MPRGDKTGPNNAGPKTGRGLGYCAGYDVAGFENSCPNQGRRSRPIRGRGLR